MATECGMKLTHDNALAYLTAIKDIFPDESDTYRCFLDLMKEYQNKRIDVEAVVARVKEMFKGHTDLILGLNIFLPKKYEIKLLADGENRPKEDDQTLRKMLDENKEVANFLDKTKKVVHPLKRMHNGQEEAVQVMVTTKEDNQPPNKMNDRHEEPEDFLKKIKTRFQDNNLVYKSFIDIMNMLGEGKKSMTEADNEVVALFEGHADLLEELTHFLPHTGRTSA